MVCGAQRQAEGSRAARRQAVPPDPPEPHWLPARSPHQLPAPFPAKLNAKALPNSSTEIAAVVAEPETLSPPSSPCRIAQESLFYCPRVCR